MFIKPVTTPFVWLWNQFFPSPQYVEKVHRDFNILCVCDEINDQIKWSKGWTGVQKFWFHTRIVPEDIERALEKLRRKGHTVRLCGRNIVEYTPV